MFFGHFPNTKRALVAVDSLYKPQNYCFLDRSGVHLYTAKSLATGLLMEPAGLGLRNRDGDLGWQRRNLYRGGFDLCQMYP